MPLLLLAATGVFASAASTSTGSQRFFFTPGPNRASCEIDAGVRGIPDSAWCLVGPPQVTVRNAVGVELTPSGKLHVCHGLRCIGNAPINTPTLRFGRSIELGPFRCTSLSTGVRCVVKKLGHGFLLGAHGLTRV